MIATYYLKNQWKQLNEDFYSKHRKIATILQIQTIKGKIRSRILQNKETNTFVICVEKQDFENNKVTIECYDVELLDGVLLS